MSLKQFPQGTCSSCPSECLMADKLSLTLLHKDILVKPCCSLFHGECVIDNAFPSNIGVPSMLLCNVRQLLPCCTMNFPLQSSVHLET